MGVGEGVGRGVGDGTRFKDSPRTFILYSFIKLAFILGRLA